MKLRAGGLTSEGQMSACGTSVSETEHSRRSSPLEDSKLDCIFEVGYRRLGKWGVYPIVSGEVQEIRLHLRRGPRRTVSRCHLGIEPRPDGPIRRFFRLRS